MYIIIKLSIKVHIGLEKLRVKVFMGLKILYIKEVRNFESLEIAHF